MTSLTADIRHEFEQITLDVHLDLRGGLTALLGSSGAGKTTVLNVIAGTFRPASARVQLDGETLADTDRRVWVPPHQRRIGYVFQDSRLFPHLTVRQNLAFGGWFRGRAAPRLGLDDVVDFLGLAPLLHRHPVKLSGGERRRVALGRALLSHPRLLLLDEPLGSLDTARRQEILPYLDRLIAELRMPMIYVTHDWAEIHGRAEQVVLMDHGASRVDATLATPARAGA
jgi:molybdate transport system ATP-binding protein